MKNDNIVFNIIKQPNSLYATWSTKNFKFNVLNLTKDDIDSLSKIAHISMMYPSNWEVCVSNSKMKWGKNVIESLKSAYIRQ